MSDQATNTPTAQGRSRGSEAYRDDIDGLRAIAVASVVASHVGIPYTRGGFSGVDIFFVISGFVITSLLVRELETTGGIGLSAFYARRVRRLLPALVVVLAATVAIGMQLFGAVGSQQALASSAISALLLVANLHFRQVTGGYFDAAPDQLPLLHLWSLSVEEQFYLVWPLLLLAAAKRAAPGKASGRGRALIGVLTLVSFVGGLALVRIRPSAGFYLMPARAWELGAGALLALSERPVRALGLGRAATGHAIAMTGLAGLIAGIMMLRSDRPYPGEAALVPVLGTVLVIAGDAWAPNNPAARFLSWRPMVIVGRLAYGWYLWHWPLLVFARYRRVGAPDPLSDIGWAALALLLAAIQLRLVENPVRFGVFARRLGARQTLLAGGGVVALGCAGAVAVSFHAEHRPRSPGERLSLAIEADRPAYPASCRLDPGLWTGRLRIEDCIIGRGAQSPTVAVWGDSHAFAWAPMVERALDTTMDRAALLSMSACPPLTGLVPRMRDGTEGWPCAQFNGQVARLLATPGAKTIAGVVLAARWSAYNGVAGIPMRDGRPAFADIRDRNDTMALASIEQGLDATLRLLAARHLRVLLVLPGPEFRASPSDCVLVLPAVSCGADRQLIDDAVRRTVAVLRRVAARYQNVRLWETMRWLCDERRCNAFLDSRPVLRDADHITQSTAVALAAKAGGDIAWLVDGQRR